MGFPWNFLSSSLGSFACVWTACRWPWAVPALSKEFDCWFFPCDSCAVSADSKSTIHFWITLISSQLSETSESIFETSSSSSTMSRSKTWSSEHFVWREVRRSFSFLTSMGFPPDIKSLASAIVFRTKFRWLSRNFIRFFTFFFSAIPGFPRAIKQIRHATRIRSWFKSRFSEFPSGILPGSRHRM